MNHKIDEGQLLNKAILLLEKYRNMNVIQERNITTYARRKCVENDVKKRLKEEIRVWDYALNVLIEKRNNR